MRGSCAFGGSEIREANVEWAESELEPSEIQDLGDAIPQLLGIKSKSGCPITFKVRIEVGDADTKANDETLAEIDQILENLKKGFGVL